MAATTSLAKVTFWFLGLALGSRMAVLLAAGVTTYYYWGDWGPLLVPLGLINERFKDRLKRKVEDNFY